MQVYSAGLDNNITVWDLRKQAESMTLKGHTDSITGLALDPNGTHLLSNAADASLRVWDLRPYAPANRCEKIFAGHQHNYERNLLRCSWSSDGSKVCLCMPAQSTEQLEFNFCKIEKPTVSCSFMRQHALLFITCAPAVTDLMQFVQMTAMSQCLFYV